MRVLFVTGEYPPMQGGVGDYTWALGTALVAQGVDVHVLTSRAAGPSHLHPTGVANVYPEISRWNWGLLSRVMRLAGEVKPNVVHIQYQTAAYALHPAINLLPWVLRHRRWPGQVAVTFHDLRVPYLLPKAGPLRWQANLMLARHSDAIIVTNAEDHLSLQRYDRLAGKLYQVPIGSNIAPQPPPDFDQDSQRDKWGIGHDGLVLGYFGFLNASKGGEELIAALAELAREGLPVHLLMIGGQVGASDPTNQAYLARVRSLIQELGVTDRVHWTGFTTASEVSANFLATDVVILPYRDGASFRRGSLMAALAHGRPVVSTKPVVAIPELVHGQNIWLVPTGSVTALVAAIKRLWADPDLRRRLGEGARRLSSHFTWDAIARHHVEIYCDFGKQNTNTAFNEQNR